MKFNKNNFVFRFAQNVSLSLSNLNLTLPNGGTFARKLHLPIRKQSDAKNGVELKMKPTSEWFKFSCFSVGVIFPTRFTHELEHPRSFWRTWKVSEGLKIESCGQTSSSRLSTRVRKRFSSTHDSELGKPFCSNPNVLKWQKIIHYARLTTL